MHTFFAVFISQYHPLISDLRHFGYCNYDLYCSLMMFTHFPAPVWAFNKLASVIFCLCVKPNKHIETDTFEKLPSFSQDFQTYLSLLGVHNRMTSLPVGTCFVVLTSSEHCPSDIIQLHPEERETTSPGRKQGSPC